MAVFDIIGNSTEQSVPIVEETKDMGGLIQVS